MFEMIDEGIVLQIIDQVKNTLDERRTMTDDELFNYIETLVFDLARKNNQLTSTKMKWLVDRVFNSFRGLDVLQPLIDDESITEIMINSHEEI